ncbi:MAG: CrcB protein [Phycisphaerales bacterium]|nr:CrcB protein [Phycisphaerales bacterium]
MELIKQCMAIGVGGFIGALSRYGVARVIDQWVKTFPLGTLVVNVSGCFVLGFFMAMMGERASETVRLGVAVGFVGAYTTFSTLMYDSSALLGRGEVYKAGLNIVASLVLGFVAVRLGAGCVGMLRIGGRLG